MKNCEKKKLTKILKLRHNIIKKKYYMVFLQIDFIELYHKKGFIIFIDFIIDNSILRSSGIEIFERYFKLKLFRK